MPEFNQLSVRYEFLFGRLRCSFPIHSVYDYAEFLSPPYIKFVKDECKIILCFNNICVSSNKERCRFYWHLLESLVVPPRIELGSKV